MQMCPDCDRVYDESDYSRCPYCSGELSMGTDETKSMDCPNCGRAMEWDDGWYYCTKCRYAYEDDENDDFDYES